MSDDELIAQAGQFAATDLERALAARLARAEELLRDLYAALRNRHYGRMPDEVQRAYDAAGAFLREREEGDEPGFTPKCDGEHAAPACEAPQCWRVEREGAGRAGECAHCHKPLPFNRAGVFCSQECADLFA